jgi:hypothetical protein
MTKGDIIRAKAIHILGQAPEGLRWSALVKKVETELPEMAENTIQGSLWNLDVVRPNDVYKPARGHWQLVKFKTTEAYGLLIAF